MHVTLVTEAPFIAVSGASFYHRRMLAAFEQAGDDIEIIALDQPAPPDLAETITPGASILVEGSGLRWLGESIAPLQARGACVLIHHPSALEPGTPEPERTALKALERHSLPGFRRVIAASAPIAERLAHEFCVDPDQICVITPGTDRQPRRMLDPARPDGSPCTVLSLGTFAPRKGHEILLQALATLADLDWHLILAGAPRDAAYHARILDLIDTLGLGARVSLRPALAGADLDAAWAQADLFALATRFEGFGMAIAEAMARGLPIAITNGGAAGSLVPAACGIIAPVDDVAQYGKALRRLVFSPSLRAELGAHAYAHSQALPDWPHQAALLRAALI
ncbi:hypothetical protein ACOSOMT5_P0479 [Acidiphilium sp. MT5]